MKAFLKALLSDNNTVSHKRFISLVSFVIIIIMGMLSLIGAEINDTVFYTFAALTVGQTALSLPEKFKKQ
jgi:hypothetical protein